MSSLKLALGLLCVQLFVLSGHSAVDSEKPSVPDIKLLGRELKNVDFIGSKKILPLQVVFDLEDGKVSGMIARYSKLVTFEQMEETLSAILSKAKKRRLGNDLIAWRNEKENYSVMLANSEDEKNVEVVIQKFLKLKRGGRYQEQSAEN